MSEYEPTLKIPEDGMHHMKVLEHTRRAAEDSLARYDKKEPAAKPGTTIDWLVMEARDQAERISNPNAIDGNMFRGTYRLEKDILSMTGSLFGKDISDPTIDAGGVLSGGTESLNQIVLMNRNKYFIKDLGIRDFRIKGLLQSSLEVARKTGKLPNPRLLCPVNYHFSNLKVADLLGMGTDSVAFYGLDEKFDVDYDSLAKTIEDVYMDGDDIILNLSLAGDVTKGKVHDISKVSEVIKQVSDRMGRAVPDTVVDMAGSYLFVGTMHDNPNYDGNIPLITFEQDDITAMICDPHKNGMPYSCGMLVLKDSKDLRFTDTAAFTNYVDVANSMQMDVSEGERTKMQALSFIPTSRSGSTIHAVWAYYMSNGISGIRKKKENIWEMVKSLRDYIDSSEHYELVCEPQTQIVPFRFNGTPEQNKQIYESIKTDRDHFHYISEDDAMFVRTEDQLKETWTEGYDNKYVGLFATIMEHNTPETIDGLKSVLDAEARNCR